MFEDEELYDDSTATPEETIPLADVIALTQELSDARQKAEENLAGWQRAQADFANIRRRLELDKADAIKYAEGELLIKLLWVLDDLDRALKHTPPELADNGWVQGMEGITRKFKGVLEAVGLKEISALGLAFDPTLHEAVACLPGADGIIIAEQDKGYLFKDRVLRPSRVVVGSGESTTEGPA